MMLKYLTVFVCLLPISAWAYTPPIGIPDPGATWEGGLHPIDTPVPSQPTGWPSSEVAGYYYIDNSDPNCTDSSNTYGYPDKPRCNFYNGTFPAGTYVEFHGSPTWSYQTTFNGTSTNPCWIVGREGDRPVFGTGGRLILTDSAYTLIDGLEFSKGTDTSASVTVDTNDNDSAETHHVVIRNCYVHDQIVGSTHNSELSFQARGGGTVHDVVIFNNRCERIGDPVSQDDADFHCSTFSLRQGSEGISHLYNGWWLHNYVYDSSGSGCQVIGWDNGHANIHHIYLGNNRGAKNRQRLIGVKESTDVVVSQNDFTPGPDWGSGFGVSESFGWAESPDYVWYIFNTLKLGSHGFRTSQPESAFSNRTHDITHVYMLGNLIMNTLYAPGYDDGTTVDNEWRSGSAYYQKNDSATTFFSNNSIYNVYNGILDIADETWITAEGNVFNDTRAGDTMFSIQSNGVNNSYWLSNYNVFYDPEGDYLWRYDSTTYATLAGWSNRANDDINSVVSDPLYIDQTNNDLHIGSNSPAIDLDASSHSAYDLFQTRYGIDIKVDFDGHSRPDGAWDAGAYEHQTSGDLTPPVISQVKAIPSVTSDWSPDYIFNSDEAGTIMYYGDCLSPKRDAIEGNNTITFSGLRNGTYSNCVVQLRDSNGNLSDLLSIPTFTINTCSDGIQNGDETGIDCGGSCQPCATAIIIGASPMIQ